MITTKNVKRLLHGIEWHLFVCLCNVFLSMFAWQILYSLSKSIYSFICMYDVCICVCVCEKERVSYQDYQPHYLYF